MKNSYRFFSNRECEYYPCHEGIEEMNCLFCYCPFYVKDKCPGKPKYVESSGSTIKDCSSCIFPHLPESYDVILAWITKQGVRESET